MRQRYFDDNGYKTRDFPAGLSGLGRQTPRFFRAHPTGSPQAACDARMISPRLTPKTLRANTAWRRWQQAVGGRTESKDPTGMSPPDDCCMRAASPPRGRNRPLFARSVYPPYTAGLYAGPGITASTLRAT